MRFIRVLLFALGLAVALVSFNNCTGSGHGLTSVAGYCGSATCNNTSAIGASIYLSSQQFTIPKALDMYGACGGSVTTTWTNGTGVASGSNGVSTCTDDRSYAGLATPSPPAAPVGVLYADAAGAFLFRQQFQVAGVCTTGGAAANQIQVAVLHNNVQIANDLYAVPYTSYTTKCDAGRFNIMLTPPACATDATIYPSGVCGSVPTTFYGQTSAALQLLVTLQTGPTLASLTTATQFATTFYVSY